MGRLKTRVKALASYVGLDFVFETPNEFAYNFTLLWSLQFAVHDFLGSLAIAG